MKPAEVVTITSKDEPHVGDLGRGVPLDGISLHFGCFLFAIFKMLSEALFIMLALFRVLFFLTLQ